MPLFAQPAPALLSSQPRPSAKLRVHTPDSAIDDALVQRFALRAEAAFVEIMARHRSRIFGAVLALLRSHPDAEEVTQDTFIRAHRGLANFRGDSALSSWLYRIAINLARNRYWHRFRRHAHDSLSMDAPLSANGPGTLADLVADGGQDPAQEKVAREFSAVADRCLAGLDKRHREILMLRNGLGHSYEEIAANLGISLGTVKSRIARAREKLRSRIAASCPEFGDGSTPASWFLHARPTYGGRAIACA